MAHRYFNFYPEDSSYEEIEEWCKEKGYSILSGEEAKQQYLKRYFSTSGNDLVFIIETYIYILQPTSERSPQSQGTVENIMFGPLADKEKKLFLAIKRDGDISRQAEYDKVKADYDALKSGTDKVYLALKRKFGKSQKEIESRREEIIALRKERGLDALGNPIKKGFFGKIF